MFSCTLILPFDTLVAKINATIKSRPGDRKNELCLKWLSMCYFPAWYNIQTINLVLAEEVPFPGPFLLFGIAFVSGTFFLLVVNFVSTTFFPGKGINSNTVLIVGKQESGA